jgi:hypothetical protein
VKTPDGKETFKITVRASGLGGQGSSAPISRQPLEPEKAGVAGQTAPAHGHPKMLKPKRPEIGNWKLNVAKNQGSVLKPKVTFDMLFNKYSKQKVVTSDRPLKKRMRSPTHQDWPSSPPRAATGFKGESSQQGRCFAPLWAPSSSSPPRPIYDDNGVIWVPYQQSFYPGRGGSRRPALDQISRPTRDRWTPRQSGQGHQDHPVRPPL